jgi:hypothetical protein
MKTLLAVAVALAVVASGCVIVTPRARSTSAATAKRCPPGHQWSDGRCHETGRGRDRR